MKKTILQYLKNRLAGLRRDDGFVVMSTLAIFLFIFVLCAFVYAVGDTIHQRIKLQNACDAAAYSAAVVQADGLSRMAVVNKAMAWSYVQMTNRQMDYITYRWLKLTCKRFNEDLENGKKFNDQLVFAVDKELGWWALLEAAVSAVVSKLLHDECSGLKDGDPKPVKHNKEGHGYWCGLETNEHKGHNIHLNVTKDFNGTWDMLKDSLTNTVQDQLYTKENIESVLNVLHFIDSGDPNSAESWGARLGELIDYDKKNINRMNNALGRINAQMSVSMRMVAESVLKSMLKDNRINPEKALEDYYISIKIPDGKDPYANVEQRSAAPESYFSPLHNTEADEMLFLNMISEDNSSKALFQNFPILTLPEFNNENLPYGLDMWFIRGKANYMDGKDHSYDSSPLEEGVAFVDKGYDPETTQRDEGALGIQRVYKDTNLNDTMAGFLKKSTKTVERQVWQGAYYTGASSSSTRPRMLSSLQPCCRSNAYQRNGRLYVLSHWHTVKEVVPEETRWTVWRGNHIMDNTELLQAGMDALADYAAGGNNPSGDGDNDDGKADAQGDMQDLVNKRSDLMDKKAGLLQERAGADPQRQAEIDSEIASIDQSISDYSGAIDQLGDSLKIGGDTGLPGGIGRDNGVNVDGDLMSNYNNEKGGLQGIGGKLMSGMASMMGNLVGQYLDIQPSTGNNPKLSYTQYPACEKIKEPTTALYSEYRWGSSKWYCVTRGWTWTICTIFRKPIYCDKQKATIAKIDCKLFTIKIKGKGIGHFDWPKWFCGETPYCLGDIKILSFLPPAWGRIDKPDNKTHGYMKHLYDFTQDGFFKPIAPLWHHGREDNSFARHEYESCAIFLDGYGSFRPYEGHKAYPALFRGHSRIYGDDKEIFDNRYIGARCKPWVLNDRFFSGDGTIVVGAARKHTNPLVYLLNLVNNNNPVTQSDVERSVISAFNIPKNNYMWTMSAARAGVRHARRNGAFDQPRQYQITYDSTSDVENFVYNSPPFVFMQDSSGGDEGSWGFPEDEWGRSHDYNPKALSRIFKTGEDAKEMPIWNGCPCCTNEQQLRALWNLCEADWDATLIPLRYANQKAELHLSKGSGGSDVEDLPFNEQNYVERCNLVQLSYEMSGDKNDIFIGNGKNWLWSPLAKDPNAFLLNNPFLANGWKPANASFFENMFLEALPGLVSTGLSTWKEDGLNLNNKVPIGTEEKTIDVLTILKDRVL